MSLSRAIKTKTEREEAAENTNNALGFTRRLKLRIDPAAMALINETALSDTSGEVGGLMLGRVECGEDGFRVDVLAAVGAMYTDVERTSIKFTSRTWHYMEQVRREKYPNFDVVGWFHTHPGKGIYLSTYHTFIHHNFFEQPWQMALVMDPAAGTHGFFGWNNGKIARMQYEFSRPVGSDHEKNSGDLIYVFNISEQIEKESPWENNALAALDDSGRAVIAAAEKNDGIWCDEPRGAARERSWISSLSLTGVLMLAFCCGFLGWHTLNLSKGLDAANERLAVIEEQVIDRQIDRQAEDAKETAVSDSSSQKSGMTPAAAAETANAREEISKSYTVQEGDTFWIISQRMYDNGVHYKKIAQHNNLPEDATLKPGQVIKIPTVN